jgi:hypothetical protein
VSDLGRSPPERKPSSARTQGATRAPHASDRGRRDAPVCSREGERRDSNPRPPGPQAETPRPVQRAESRFLSGVGPDGAAADLRPMGLDNRGIPPVSGPIADLGSQLSGGAGLPTQPSPALRASAARVTAPKSAGVILASQLEDRVGHVRGRTSIAKRPLQGWRYRHPWPPRATAGRPRRRLHLHP